MKRIYIILFCLVLIQGCTKQPTAAFVTDKTNYEAGETIHLTNKSINADSYLWTLPNGQSISKDLDYTLDEYQPAGTRTFHLIASSKKGKKIDETEQTVTVTASDNGAVVFWQKSSGSIYNLPLNISLGGIGSQVITQSLPALPDCDNTSCAVFKNLPPGSYTWSGSNGQVFLNGSVTIVAGICLKVQLN